MSARSRSRRPKSKSQQEYIKQLQRNRGDREINKRVLVVCEDEKSAPNYFNALRQELRLSALEVEVASSHGRTQPIQVVQEAQNRCTKAKEADNPFDEAWAIIDGDYGVAINNARNSATQCDHEIHLAITTPCFEYWVILHFEDYFTTLQTSAQIETHLKAHIANYDKGSTKFERIVGSYKDAVDRARRGRNAEAISKPEDQNPCSEIDKLIDSINT